MKRSAICLLLALAATGAMANPPPDPLPFNLTCTGENNSFQATLIEGSQFILANPREILMFDVQKRTWTQNTVSIDLGADYKALVKRTGDQYHIAIRMPDNSTLTGTCVGKSK